MRSRNSSYYPRRVAVKFPDGSYGLGELMYTTINGDYVVHLDGDSDISTWNATADTIEFLEDANEIWLPMTRAMNDEARR